jgi:GAF domain-containing protein
VPAKGGIVGAVFQSGKAETIADAYTDSRFNQAVDQATGYRTTTILATPITHGDGHAVGVVQVLNKSTGVFDANDLNLIASMARHAAAALERVVLTEKLDRAKRDEA